MATKPAASAVKKPGTAVVDWKARLASAALRQTAVEKPMGGGLPTISTRGGILSVDGDPVKGGSLDVVILASAHVNAYYPGRFDPDAKAAPVCYAFGDQDSDDPQATMMPHAESEEPQAKTCDGCEMNIMGSADTGRGKACKNVRRLAVVSTDALESAEAMAEAEVRVINLPVTSVKNWVTFARKVNEELSVPTYGVVTNISCAPDAKTQYKVLISMVEAIEFDAKLYAALEAKIAEVQPTIVAPYPKNADLQTARESKPAGGKAMRPMGRVAAKAVAGKAPPAKTGRKF
jgi:hypothetical protein